MGTRVSNASSDVEGDEHRSKAGLTSSSPSALHLERTGRGVERLEWPWPTRAGRRGVAFCEGTGIWEGVLREKNCRRQGEADQGLSWAPRARAFSTGDEGRLVGHFRRRLRAEGPGPAKAGSTIGVMVGLRGVLETFCGPGDNGWRGDLQRQLMEEEANRAELSPAARESPPVRAVDRL